MDTPDPEPFDPPAVYCRHLLVCRMIWYDPAKTGEEYSLGRMVVDLKSPPGVSGRFVVPRLFVYTQFYGDLGEYDLRLRLVAVTIDADGDESSRPVTEWGPWLFPISGLELVDSSAIKLDNVPFDGPGLYEFQLWIDESAELLATERVRVVEPIEELP